MSLRRMSRGPIALILALAPASTASLAPALALGLTLVLAACSSPAPASPNRTDNPDVAAYFDAVRDTYVGDSARAVVAFMDGRFRLPGNSGFDASIARVVTVLEGAGYVAEADAAPDARLTYRVERRPMDRPTWEPIAGRLDLVVDPAGGTRGGTPGGTRGGTPAGTRDGTEGETEGETGGETVETLLSLATNLNMIAINSASTAPDGVEAELIYVGSGDLSSFAADALRGKIVFGETSVSRLFSEAVVQRGALGVLSYSMPSYTRPEQNPTSIQFSSIRPGPEGTGWGLRLSYAARQRLLQALEQGPVRVRVTLETRIFEADELTLVADIDGRTRPDERMVLSAHVQEPGANDNASGVGAQAELARTLATLVADGRFDPERTVTMLWGDEISSTRRYIADDAARAQGILWGLSLDMVGEDTELTGGTFLIEKMPDPSAIWTRGDDQHTEWWGPNSTPLTLEQMTPHYYNDFILARCRDQAAHTGWIVRANPFEGGSDHVPFLRADIPGLLMWHFTDQFYHTDSDRIDKVSAATLANVGTCAAVSTMTLTTADGAMARAIVAEIEAAALDRLETEAGLSRAAITEGAEAGEQLAIVRAWTDWYRDALHTAVDLEVGGSSPETLAAIEEAAAHVVSVGEAHLAELDPNRDRP